MKLALLTTDNREHFRQYEKEVPWFGTAPAALLEGLAKIPDLEVHVISCTSRPMKSPAKLAENIHFHSLHVPKLGWMRTLYQGCIRATRRKLQEIRPDIVHGQGTERDCAISAVFSGYPNVLTIHGKMTEIETLTQAQFGSYVWWAARLETFTLPRTNGIICISSYVKNLIKNHHVPSWFIPNALQQMFFDYPRFYEKRQTPLLLNVGVISPRKRQIEILEVLKSLREEGFNFETIFVGTLESTNAYAAQFESAFLKAQADCGDFSHISRLSNEEFCRLFDSSSAMVHFSSEESFGLVFGEALARNLHLFASDVGSVKDISEGVNGVDIFDLNDWAGLKAGLRKWLQTDQFKSPKPESSPSGIVDRYHPQSIAEQHLRVYQEVLGQAGSRSKRG